MTTETIPWLPPINPSRFDLIVIGTSLPSSIIAAAASTAGKSVLHLESNFLNESHFSSFSLDDLTSFFTTDAVTHDVEITPHDQNVIEHSEDFLLDLSGPRVLFSADECVNLLLRSGGNQYVERFTNINASFVAGERGELESTPDSRNALFPYKGLNPREKYQVNSFFKMALAHSSGEKRIEDEDLESSFVAFLDKQNLPKKIKSIILYAIAMVDYDQYAGDSCKDILKARDGIDRLALYQSSFGRFPTAPGALLYPLYGQDDLQGAFERHISYYLRGPEIPVLLNEDGTYKGVKLINGQEITSDKLVMDPSFTIRPSPVNPPSEDVSNVFKVGGVSGKVARGISITNSSIKPNISGCLVIYPPRSLYPDQATSIRVLQLGSNIDVCPPGMFVVYFSALCDDALEGKKSLRAAMDSLFSVHTLDTADSSSTDHTDSAEVKPNLLWSALYIQDLIEGSMGPVVTTPTPDGNLNYNDLIGSTLKLFQKLYPDDDPYPFPGTRTRSRPCFCPHATLDDEFFREAINTVTPTLRIS